MSDLGVHSLDHFALCVPDLAEASEFYNTFGLDVRADGNVLGVHLSGSPHRAAVLLEGRSKRLHHLSFGVFERDFESFKVQLKRFDLVRCDPPPGLEGTGLWIHDPDGVLIELRVAPKTSPDRKAASLSISAPPGTAGAPKRSQAPVVKPSRLAHCLTFTRDVSRAISFYTQVLGLKLSDRSGDDIAFMHGIHGSDHHLIAFARANAPGLHHCCWAVRSFDELGLGAMQMARKGHAEGWGLGRHVLGSNYFHYVRDPWNSYCEYSWDIDYIPAGQRWEAGDHDADDAFYIWGPNPPADWTHNHEADPR